MKCAGKNKVRSGKHIGLKRGLAAMSSVLLSLSLMCCQVNHSPYHSRYYQDRYENDRRVTYKVEKRHPSTFIVEKPFIETWTCLVEFVSENHINPNIDLENNLITVNSPMAVRAKFIDTYLWNGENTNVYILSEPMGDNKSSRDYQCRTRIKYNIFVKEIDRTHTKVSINIFGNGIEVRRYGDDDWVTTDLDGVSSGLLESQIRKSILKDD